jgi:hypothetical protein
VPRIPQSRVEGVRYQSGAFLAAQVELKTERFVMALTSLRAPFVQHALAWFSDAQLNVVQLIGLRAERTMLKSRSI